MIKLVEIADRVSINPEKVTSVRKEGLSETKKVHGHYRTETKEVVNVYLNEIDGDYSDISSITYSARVLSKYNYKDTIDLLTNGRTYK